MYQEGNAAFAAAKSEDEIEIVEAMRRPLRQFSPPTWRDRIAELDLIPDLGNNIGSLVWFRGLATFTVLSVGALSLLPDFGPVYGAAMPVPSVSEMDEARSQMIMPLALGADSGRRMAATEKVRPLAGSPERPTIETVAALGRGESFVRVLERAGVASKEAKAVEAMVSGATSLSEVEPGTPIEIRLGARTSKSQPRPLEHLTFRARFDLRLSVKGAGGRFSLRREAIAVDETPLRIRGIVGDSLYRSARAAGASADAIQSYLKIIVGRISLSDVQPSDEFDIIMSHKRAATGESKPGEMLYAGLDRGGNSKIQMLKWTNGENSQWFEASGVGQSKGQFARPVAGALSSNYGMRRHPILGYMRMHAGVDFGAPHGAPIFATADGSVDYAGRKGGYGNFVQINHGGGLASGYGHMSRIVARPGSRVRQGQIIGYVGSTGLSTGPHLHYEMYRGGRQINPTSVQYVQRAQLSGPDLAKFRAKLNGLKAVKPGAALAAVQGSRKTAAAAPVREINKLTG